jgi:hypothetical protein
MTAYAGQITISKANPIRWVHNDSLAAHFDNTLTADESFPGVFRKSFSQKFISADTVPLQLKLYGNTSGNEVIVKKYVNGTETVIAATATTVYASFTIYEYLITITTGETFYLKAYTDIDTWTSEPICGEATLPHHVKLQWFNYDPLTYNENWQFDYQTTQAKAVVNFLYLEANLFEYSSSGEKTVIDNQNEKIVLKRSVFRRLKLEAAPVPRWLSEKLLIAMAHDVFVVNDVSYILEEDANAERAGKTNFVNFSAVLTQKAVLGLNTYDIGFICDATTTESMIILQELAASGGKTFAITDDYLILTITGERVAGSPTIKAGTTLGGDDILLEMALTPTYTVEAALVATDKASIPGGILYVTVSGVGATANIYVATFKNRQ